VKVFVGVKVSDGVGVIVGVSVRVEVLDGVNVAVGGMVGVLLAAGFAVGTAVANCALPISGIAGIVATNGFVSD
jgi:hypothetical protein